MFSHRVSCAACVVTLGLLGCDSSVELVGGGGSDPSTGGETTGGAHAGAGGDGGGGAPSGPRLIEVDFGPTPERVLLVNDASGILKQSLPLDGEVVQVEVMDGDLVSVLEEADTQLRSFRVTPELIRIVDGLGTGGYCETEPMEVRLIFPEVEGAINYEAMTEGYAHAARQGSGEEVLQVQSCTETFDVVAAARDGWGTIVRHELVRGVPFTPGGSLTLPLTMANADRSSFTVTLVDLDGVAQLGGEAMWRRSPSMLPRDRMSFELEAPAGTRVIELNPIRPEVGYGSNAVSILSIIAEKGDEWCDRQGLFRLQGNESFEYAPTRLASIRQAAGGSWSFGADGARGDVVWQTWSFEDGYDWYVLEDAARPPLAAAFPELPSSTQWPVGAPSLASIGHRDLEERDGYAAVLAQPALPDSFTESSRSWSPCFEEER